MAINFYYKIHRAKVQNLNRSSLSLSHTYCFLTSGSIEQPFRNVLAIELLTLSISTFGQLIVFTFIYTLRMVALLVEGMNFLKEIQKHSWPYRKIHITTTKDKILTNLSLYFTRQFVTYLNRNFCMKVIVFISSLIEHGQIYDQHILNLAECRS